MQLPLWERLNQAAAGSSAIPSKLWREGATIPEAARITYLSRSSMLVVVGNSVPTGTVVQIAGADKLVRGEVRFCNTASHGYELALLVASVTEPPTTLLR